MTVKERTRISKFLSYVLRHKPDAIGVELDEAGWIDIDLLLEECAAHGTAISRVQLDEVVATSDKQRFAISDDGRRIRASQGHSVEVALAYESCTPPDVLFHGTVERVLPAIRAGGLRKMQRHHVHLSVDEETASMVGQRRGRPVILRIDARRMHVDGHRFFISANGVWLTEKVPPEYIDLGG